MQIDSAIYRNFYQKLWEAFAEREWLEEDKPKRYSQYIWNIKDKGNKYVVVERFLKYTRYRDERYFYRRYLDLNPIQTSKGEVDDLAMAEALEYLGYKVPEDVKDREHLNVRADHLLKQYIENNFQDYKVEDKNSDKMQVESSSNPGDYSRPAQMDKPVADVKVPQPSGAQEDDVRFLIADFYEKISAGEYREAWELLTPEFQNRIPWNGDVSRFVEGYTNTTFAKDVMVFNVVKRFPTLIEAQVYYQDEIAAYTSPDLSSLFSMTVADIDDFVKNIRYIQKRIEDNGGKNFEKLELYKLFEQGASEYIWYKCGIKPADIPNVFPARRTISVRRFYYCSCKLINDKWLINGIRGMFIESAR